MPKGRIKFNVKVTGVDDLLSAFGTEGAKELSNELDKVVERNAVRIANQAKENAPYKTGKLKNSIHLYGRPAKMARIIGSNVPYATRQEYEHATKKAFFRRALWKGRKPFREEIRAAIEARKK